MRLLAITLLASCIAAASGAEDRVTIIPEGALDPVVLIGSVEEYTGEELVLKRPEQPVGDRYPASTVQSVQTWRSALHEQALTEFSEGRNAPAEQSFLKALPEEPRDWMQREILAHLVRCAIRRGDGATAGTRFLQITKQDPLTPHWNIAPILWAPRSMGDSQKTLARTWLKESDAPASLLAASWLLVDPVYGEAAEKQLGELARHSNRVISSLARTQLWRLKLGLAISEIEVQKWQREVRRMPRPLRAGPQYLVARGLFQRNEPGPAAAELLWLATVYTDNEDLSARALVEAAGAIEKSGQTKDAWALYTQAIKRFGWSPWANEARAARSVLSSPANSRENAGPE